MKHFQSEYFILLTSEELKSLVKAQNRDDYLPDLKLFLQQTKNLKLLRQLNFEPNGLQWTSPSFSENENGEIFDRFSNRRGYRKILPLPARPGEPQMALSYDWFWERFCEFLLKEYVFATLKESELQIVCSQQDVNNILKNLWVKCWDKLSNRNNLQQATELYLNNKTLFKSQASPWTSKAITIISEEQSLFLINYYQYGSKHRALFKQQSIASAVMDLKKVVKEKQYVEIPFPSNSGNSFIKGGDFHKMEKKVSCAGCGELLNKENGYPRSALLLKDADERAQSAEHKDQLNTYCPRCVATVFFCPVKLTPETLTIRFIDTKGKLEQYSANPIVSRELKKYVAQSLHVLAGNFVSIHIEERVDRKPLNNTMGSYHYSLWKMGITFSPELFEKGFGVEVYPGEETFRIPLWQLWLISALASWDDVFRYKCYGNKEFRPHFNQYLRFISRGKIFQGFYTLLTGKLIYHSYAGFWKMNILQDIWNRFETILKKEEPMPIPDYPMIVGFAGLLLPLAQRVEHMQPPNEKKRAVTKLLEEVDKPIQFAYTASRESGSKEFIFCKRPANKYFFDKAVELLEYAGEDVQTLMQEAENVVNDKESFAWARNTDQKMFISTDQIARVTSALVCEGEKPYANEADWRAFAYQAKLALWSFFPAYLGAKE